MLDAAPELGWRDVHNILALSAGHTGSAYGSGDGIDDWSWEFNSAVDWNGGGRDYDYNFGYGMVDAFAAVRMAEAWGRMSGEAQTSANEVTIAAAYEGATVSLDRNATVTASLNVTNDIEIESIYLTLSFQQVEAFDLKLWLRAPDGHEFAVLLDDSNWRLAASGLEYTFAIEDARGMTSVGQWTLVVMSMHAFYDGKLFDFDIEFHGRTVDANDIHAFTDDFLALERVSAIPIRDSHEV